MQVTGQELYTLDLSTGMEEAAEPDALIHPNPASGYLNMTAFPLNTTLRLFGTDGRLALTASRQAHVDISALPAGVYAARVDDTAGSTLTHQLVVIER